MRVRLPDAVRARFDPGGRYGLRVSLLAIAMVLVAVPFSSLTFQVLADGPITRLDGEVANRLNDWVHRSDTAVTVLEAISWLGRPLWFYVLIGGASAYLWRHGRRTRLIVFLVVTSLGGGIVDTVVKIAVDRPRPVVDHPVATAFGKSFPSGHSMSSVVCYGALMLVFLPVFRSVAARRLAVGLTGLVVLAIGCSRLLLGVHFVSDVIGGYVLGAAWLIGAVAAFEIWRVETGRRPTAPLEEGVEPEAAAALTAPPSGSLADR
jgi:membrane-associated phospholipid phosphatase